MHEKLIILLFRSVLLQAMIALQFWFCTGCVQSWSKPCYWNLTQLITTVFTRRINQICFTNSINKSYHNKNYVTCNYNPIKINLPDLNVFCIAKFVILHSVSMLRNSTFPNSKKKLHCYECSFCFHLAYDVSTRNSLISRHNVILAGNRQITAVCVCVV